MSKEEQTLRIDFDNMLANRIGGLYGITREELETQRVQAAKYFQELMEERSKGSHPFLELPYQKEVADRVLKVARQFIGRVEDFVVLGIGGSALGNIALHRALNPPNYNELKEERKGFPRIHIIDTIDPDIFSGLLRLIKLEKTAFNVISKSGSTVETMAQFLIVRNLLKERLGRNYNRHLIATTDPENGALRQIAQREGYITFDIPKGVGGRFSVLSPVGLLSAAVSGIDINRLLSGAGNMDYRCRSDSLWENPALMNSILQYISYTKGRHISVIMPYSSALEGVAEWFCQLWAESLGKRLSLEGQVVNCGPTPVKALGPKDQHSQLQLYMEGPYNKVITFLAVDKFNSTVGIHDAPEEDLQYLSGHTLGGLMEAERKGTQIALTEAGRPNCTIYLPELSAFHVGELLYMFQLQTVLAGKFFRVNAFDQPGVEAGKINTFALLGRKGFEERKKVLGAFLSRLS